MFSIDGVQWPYPCDITRVAELTASDISGMMLDKSYFNDVLGTYMQYTVKLAVPVTARDTYTTIYEMLTDPVDAHTFILPYNQGNLTIVARVDSVSDVYVRLADGGIYWKGIQFTITANHPSKEYSLNQVLARGRSPLPELAEVSTGAIYEYTSTGWVPAEYGDADTTYY